MSVNDVANPFGDPRIAAGQAPAGQLSPSREQQTLMRQESTSSGITGDSETMDEEQRYWKKHEELKRHIPALQGIIRQFDRMLNGLPQHRASQRPHLVQLRRKLESVIKLLTDGSQNARVPQRVPMETLINLEEQIAILLSPRYRRSERTTLARPKPERAIHPTASDHDLSRQTSLDSQESVGATSSPVEAVPVDSGCPGEDVALTNKELRVENATLREQLNQEMSKSACQICYEKRRDCLIMPCLHLQYCFDCMAKHYAKNKKCPTCRSMINGLMKCQMWE